MRYIYCLVAGATFLTTACQNGAGYQNNQNTYQGAAIGAAAGGAIGALSGDHDAWKRAGIGAGIGALAGAGIGQYMDSQEQSLRTNLQGTGIDVQRQGNDLNLIIPENVTFDFDRAELKPQGQATLGRLAGVLSQYPQTIIEITGHADSTGDANYNMKLSDRRAAAVASYLTSHGVSQRIISSGVGESSPIATNDTPDGRAQNRRVEIKISPLSN